MPKYELSTTAEVPTYDTLRAYVGRSASVTVSQGDVRGVFVDDESDTTSADNGGTVTVGYNGKRWKRVFDGAFHATWFGVTVNGADSTAALHKAIAAAAAAAGAGVGIVVLPPGTVRVTGITLESNVILRGAGKYATTLKLVDGLTAPVPVLKATSKSSLGVSDLTIDGNKAGRGDSTDNVGYAWEGLNCILCEHVYVDNVRIINCANEGWDIDGGSHIYGSRLVIEDCGGSGLHPSNGAGLDTNTGVVLKDIISRRNGLTHSRPGLYALGSTRFRLRGYDSEGDYIGLGVEGNASQKAYAVLSELNIRTSVTKGVQLYGNAVLVDVESTVVVSPGTDGFWTDGASSSKNSAWSGIKVYSAGAIGIRIAGSGWTLENAIVEDSVGAGISIATTSTGTLINPRTARTGGVGITTDSSVKIVMPDVTDATGAGIYLNAVDGCQILGGRSVDTRSGGSRTQTYGVYMNSSASSLNHRILGLDVRNNATENIRRVGTGHRIHACAGANDTLAPLQVDGWYFQDAAVSTGAYVALSRFSTAVPSTWAAPSAGTITAIGVQSSESRTAGTLTIQVFKNGSVVAGSSAQLIASSPAATLSTVSISVSAGDRIDLRYITSADWAPVTADITACVVFEIA